MAEPGENVTMTNDVLLEVPSNHYEQKSNEVIGLVEQANAETKSDSDEGDATLTTFAKEESATDSVGDSEGACDLAGTESNQLVTNPREGVSYICHTKLHRELTASDDGEIRINRDALKKMIGTSDENSLGEEAASSGEDESETDSSGGDASSATIPEDFTLTVGHDVASNLASSVLSSSSSENTQPKSSDVTQLSSSEESDAAASDLSFNDFVESSDRTSLKDCHCDRPSGTRAKDSDIVISSVVHVAKLSQFSGATFRLNFCFQDDCGDSSGPICVSFRVP